MLIFCSAGMSRSAAIAAAAIATARGSKFEEELERLSNVKRVDVSPGLWHNLRVIMDSSALE
jgi:predicted protein tyrosine phosphatase